MIGHEVHSAPGIAPATCGLKGIRHLFSKRPHFRTLSTLTAPMEKGHSSSGLPRAVQSHSESELARCGTRWARAGRSRWPAGPRRAEGILTLRPAPYGAGHPGKGRCVWVSSRNPCTLSATRAFSVMRIGITAMGDARKVNDLDRGICHRMPQSRTLFPAYELLL
jgi:hypothetical protein